MPEVYATGPRGQKYYSKRAYQNARAGYELTAARRNRQVYRSFRRGR